MHEQSHIIIKLNLKKKFPSKFPRKYNSRAYRRIQEDTREMNTGENISKYKIIQGNALGMLNK